MISEHSRIVEIAGIFPGAARLFDEAGIEYDCSSSVTLSEACAEKGLNAGEMITRISVNERGNRQILPRSRWNARRLSEILTHLLESHAFYRKEFRRLEKLMNRVHERHRHQYGNLLPLHEIFFELKAELLVHLDREEAMLFPYVGELERASLGTAPSPSCPFGTIHNPLRVMRRDHDAAQDSLARIRVVSLDFHAPPTACLGFKLLMWGLADLETDLNEHIGLENENLFPRAAAAEQQVVASELA